MDSTAYFDVLLSNAIDWLQFALIIACGIYAVKVRKTDPMTKLAERGPEMVSQLSGLIQIAAEAWRLIGPDVRRKPVIKQTEDP